MEAPEHHKRLVADFLRDTAEYPYSSPVVCAVTGSEIAELSRFITRNGMSGNKKNGRYWFSKEGLITAGLAHELAPFMRPEKAVETAHYVLPGIVAFLERKLAEPELEFKAYTFGRDIFETPQAGRRAAPPPPTAPNLHIPQNPVIDLRKAADVTVIFPAARLAWDYACAARTWLEYERNGPKEGEPDSFDGYDLNAAIDEGED